MAEYDEATLEKIAESYAEQVGILKFLGFDMASIHFAYRGQLPSQFLSPLDNHRTDAYGGSLENRARFPLMILRKIREKVGSDFIVECLLSAHETEGGYTLDDTVTFLNMAKSYIDIVQLRAATVELAHHTGFLLEATPFIDQASYIKERVSGLLIATIGGYQDFDVCESVIADGKADIVSMGRSWISNPDYGKLAYEGRQEDLVPCLRCNKCHGRGKPDPFVSVCSVNPLIGIEHMVHKLGQVPENAKKVAVIGGGPAGMKVAMDLCDRGHTVSLYEAKEHLGGNIHHSDYVDFKWPLKKYKDYLIHQVYKREIEVHLGRAVEPSDIKDIGYDVVVAALGAEPIKPPILGNDKENVFFATNVMLDASAIKETVVVIGGGEVGVEAGMYLAQSGRHVTVIEMRDMLAADSTLIHYREMFEEAWANTPNFHYVLNGRCQRGSFHWHEGQQRSGTGFLRLSRPFLHDRRLQKTSHRSTSHQKCLFNGIYDINFYTPPVKLSHILKREKHDLPIVFFSKKEDPRTLEGPLFAINLTRPLRIKH